MGCASSSEFSLMSTADSKGEILSLIDSAPTTTTAMHDKLGSKLVINTTTTRRLRREKVILKLRSDRSMNHDIKYLSSPPCVNFCKVIEGVYLTSYSGITEENVLQNGIKLIVNVTYETPLIDTPEVTSLRVPIDDVLSENIYPYFGLVIPVLEKVAGKGYPIVFHCLVGKSRSASMVLAYLIKVKLMTLEEAFRHLYSVRPIIHPNLSFMKALMRWEKAVHERNTIELIQIDFSGVRLEIADLIIRSYPKVYASEVNSQLQYFGYTREQRNAMIKTGVQKTRSSLKLPPVTSKEALSSLVSDYDGQVIYEQFSKLVKQLDSAQTL